MTRYGGGTVRLAGRLLDMIATNLQLVAYSYGTGVFVEMVKRDLAPEIQRTQ